MVKLPKRVRQPLALDRSCFRAAGVTALGALALSGCQTAGQAFDLTAALRAIGTSREAYCSLAPEGRAEIRAKLGLKAQYIVCPGDEPPQ
jgi:hypothetical protein